jgi:hypothetical protein
VNNSDILRGALAIGKLSATPTSIPNDIGWAKRKLMVRDLSHEVFDRSGSDAPVPILYRPFTHDGIHIKYVTGSGNALELHVSWCYLARSEVPLVTDWERVAFCGNCKGSKGGCPGFSPKFVQVKPKSDNVFIIATHMDMRWAVKHSRPKPTPTVMYPLTYADRLTLFFTGNLAQSVAKNSGSYALSLGSCRGCYGKNRCTVIMGEECANPTKRTYSIESTGVDADELHMMLQGEFLPWYYLGTNQMQTYMSRYALVFCDNRADYVALLKAAILNYSSYAGEIEFDSERGLESLKPILADVPSGAHKGSKQWIYDGIQYASYVRKGGEREPNP